MKITQQQKHLIATTIRTLAIDAVQKAKSGHPGMPMGCAEIATVLWSSVLRHNPENPRWANRDRFVLSAGHGSMLLYTMLHLSGYELSLEDLVRFRQWGSITPGHPEYAHTPGVETTTGPLGQGFANAVGMAYARNLIAREFNTGEPVIDHYIYAIAGDGDLMEGVSYEAASLAGHWGLGGLIVIYDSNEISIEGPTSLAFSDDIAGRFNSCGWQVQSIDGHDFSAIERALKKAQREKTRPSLIIAKTRIAKGSPGKEGSEESHGAPLGEDEVRKTKLNLGCDGDASFCVPDEVYAVFRERRKELSKLNDEWNKRFESAIKGEARARWDKFFDAPDVASLMGKLPAFDPAKAIATRSASGKMLDALFREMPNIVGGSADLGPSNKSFVKGYDESGKNTLGRNIHFGIREHAMGAIQNGIAYYGGLIPYSASFFVFMDYMRPPIRIAALAGLQAIYIFTHDSLFVGEDGPTHQPVEHLATARAIPNLTVIRPADAEETREAWCAALQNTKGPTALILSRQDLPVVSHGGKSEGLHRGAYVLWEPAMKSRIILIATGSEIHIALQAAQELSNEGVGARVVSFPSWELFEKQPEEYRRSIFPETISKRAVIEAGLSLGWERYAGPDALFITMERFGASAPAQVLAERFGFTKENILRRVREYLKR